MTLDRHNRDEGNYYCIVCPTSPEVTDTLDKYEIKYTRKTPTEIRFTCNYIVMSEVKDKARHLTWVRQ